MKLFKYIILLFIINGIYRCNAQSQCEVAQVCITDLSQEDCGAGMQLIQNHNIFNCCPGCGPISGGGNEDNETG